MPRFVLVPVAALVFALSGCSTGPAEPEMSAEELTAAQTRDQKEADAAERQHNKETRAARKKG